MISKDAIKKVLAARTMKQKPGISKADSPSSLTSAASFAKTQTRVPASAKKGSAATVSKQDSPIGTAMVTCNSLNVRSGAGTNYERIGGLSYGKSVEVYEVKSGWLRIKYNGADGWISQQYTNYKSNEPVVTPDPEPDPVVTPEPEPEPSFTEFNIMVTSDNGLNIRDIPGNGTSPAGNSTVLGGIGYGAVVTVTAEQNGWYKINYNGIEGWICGTWTQKVDGGSTNPGGDSGGGAVSPGATGSGQAAADYAASFLGQTTKNLLGILPNLQDLSGIAGTNNGYDLNCANFATAILQTCGLLSGHSNMVSGARSIAISDGYKKTTKANCHPGDLWLNGNQHAELVYSNSGGTVTLIGSNNGGDDIQEISKDSWSPNNYNADYYTIQ